MNWYYADGEKKVGPVTETEIKQLLAKGKITSETLVWNEIMSKWQPYGKLNDVADKGSSQEADAGKKSFCVKCGRTFSVDELVKHDEAMVCASCEPAFFQKSKGASLPNFMNYAGFWIRFVAVIIDGIILSVVNFFVKLLVIAIGFTSGAVSAAELGKLDSGQFVLIILYLVKVYTVLILIYMAYEVFFVGKFAATPGKMACGLKVVTADGGTVSYARAVGRFFAKWLSNLTLLIGYIMAAFDYEKRALHDHICGTRVIRK